MKKSIFMALAGVMMVSSAAHAISVTGEAGEHYTNLGVGFGTESTGLAVSGNWLHSDNDGDAAGLGLELNIPLGPFLATVGGKVFTPIRNRAMKVMRPRSAAACSGKSATASACTAIITTLRIRFPAALIATRKPTSAPAGPLCVRLASRPATVT
ncbi:outer membrane protein, YfaZ [Klebsiella pneumoniae]|uniref:Outer membrane protein, YfaZ n=1 Tax=Klebsiella pneumoniae TaxID=573 RepID=A0A377WNU6_KLEPN|nr:outer membrane protein, YfaZ [Klebsiella pneumoniae]